MRKRMITVFAVLSIGSAATFAQDNQTASSPIMDKLASSRDVEVTDAQLEELKTLLVESPK